MIAEMSAAARRQAITNALVVCSLGFAVTGLAALGFAVTLGRSWIESLLFGLALVVGISYLLGLRSWLRGRRRAGGVLLDCGPHPSRRSSLINAASFFVSGVVLSLISLSSSGIMNILGLFVMLHAIIMALIALRHFQLREHGLWSGMGLLPWDKIESFWWDGDWTLMMTTKGSRWLFKKGAYLVRPDLREAVDRLLRARVPTPHPRRWGTV